MEIKRPTHIPEHAEVCLSSLTERNLGRTLSLGGAFGLLHYLDYRTTDDVDAWWEPAATRQEREQVVAAVEEALRSAGEVGTRAWGEVVSIELKQGAVNVFSFQIAERSVRLEPPRPAPWEGLLLDSFADLLASKMVALVERGAPRDFRDIYSVCQAGLTSPGECWRLWQRRQQLAGGGSDAHRARLAVETHLARIVRHRPLAKIAEPEARAAAERARAWYRKELLDALVD